MWVYKVQENCLLVVQGVGLRVLMSVSVATEFQLLLDGH